MTSSFIKLTFVGSFLILSFVLLLSPDSANAQSLAEYAGCSGPDCSTCNLVDLANGVIQWIIGILFVVFAGVMAWAGFGLVTSNGNHHALDEAKGYFVNAIVGFIIMLSAWLIIDTVMRGLIGTSSNPGSVQTMSGWLFWAEVECYEQTEVQDPPDWISPDVPYEPLSVDEQERFLVDDGTGRAGSVQVNTPAGMQNVDIQACDTSNIVRINFLGQSVQIHRQFAPSLQRIDAQWRSRGGNSFYRVTSVGGYNCRNIAGTNRRSNHAYGLAVDINPAQNPHTFPGSRNYGQTNMPPAFVQLFTREGWGWGGNWNSSKDTMHFSKASGEGGNMRGQ